MIREGALEDGVLHFGSPSPARASVDAPRREAVADVAAPSAA